MTSSELLSTGGLCVESPAGRPLFRELNLSLGREPVAIVGRNGVGKSSLLAVLAGAESAERGRVRCRGTRVLVPQRLEGEPSAASPGERRRQRLEAAFRGRPDLLMLDEPTQDLDAGAIRWLVDRLRRWDDGLIVVSHDRRLLRLFSDFFVVAESGCRHFSGSFDALVRDLEAESRVAQEVYLRNLHRLEASERRRASDVGRRERKRNVGRIREIGRSKARILMNSKRGAAQASQGKRTVLQQDRIQAARQWTKATRRALTVDLPLNVLLPGLPVDTGPPVARLDGVGARAGERILFTGLDLELSRPDRLAITGPNGAGKTTLLEILVREREPNEGRARAQLERIGYIAQDGNNWRSPESLLERLTARAAGPEQAAQYLVGHRFPLALAERPLASLSPGERVRAALICLLHRRPVVDFLVLDEPTDALDFVGVVALERGLREWGGGLCVVSHDEEFLDAIGVRRRIPLGGTVIEGARCQPGSAAARSPLL
ncbi:MAG: ATP-binding cassette domain-containing protein [Myxococcales bacterium]|nr:ATP-binding cassette domain-containing protein [Myxococcales bacterium]